MSWFNSNMMEGGGYNTIEDHAIEDHAIEDHTVEGGEYICILS